MTFSRRFVSLVATAALLAGVVANGTSQAAEYFKGKTLTLIVPVPAGSGLDRIARSFARYWEKHIPGNPEIVPKNMPGGGGAQALNFLNDKARADGTTVAWGPWNAAGLITGAPGLRYDPAKFEFIGAGGDYAISMMRTDVAPGIKTSADVVKPKKIIVGGRRPDRSLDIIGNLALEMIGAKIPLCWRISWHGEA